MGCRSLCQAYSLIGQDSSGHRSLRIKIKNHTSKFWNIVETQAPKYLKAKKWLKENGEILESEF
jgi:ABC-type lipoprotein release transport system permease subunit